ncbi:MAG: hypothetical protein CVU88_07540 [Firmicutes bacterium HGW-Firmicutes-13]|nr:MAG: hypothetical protein CVU88_07540 [Firmicutes bacterium HGW-Firmicutes-13]
MFEDLGKYYYRQGLRLAKEKRITPAVTALERAAALRQEDWKSWNVLGLCYYRLGKFRCAGEAWEQSLFRCPDENKAALYLEYLKSSDFLNICSKYNQGLELTRKGKYRKAEKILEKRELLNFVSFSNLLGLCLYAQGKKKRAFQVWRQVLSMDRDNLLTLKYIQKSDIEFSIIEEVNRLIKSIFSRR